MSLHLVFSTLGWQSCQKLVKPEDGVVLMGDGAYLARQLFQHKSVFVLQEDLEVRGLHEQTEVSGISYAQLVELTIQHKPVVSWTC